MRAQDLDELLDDGVDLLFCNQQEALMYTETDNIEQALAKLQLKSKYTVITLSSEGALISDTEHSFKVPGRQVTAVDANGAGDAFAGAFLYALNQGESLKTAAEAAVLISIEVVAQFGPRLDIKSYATLSKVFKRNAHK